MICKNKPACGFSLIEVVVAVAIFAVMSAIIFPAVLQFLQIREQVIKRSDDIVGLQKVFLFLSRDLRFANNRLNKDVDGEKNKTTLLINDEDLLDIATSYPDARMNGLNIPRRVRWRLEDGMLTRIQHPVIDPDADGQVLQQNLLDGVQAVDLQIHYLQNGRDLTEDEWEEQSRLPEMVEINIDLGDKGHYQRFIGLQDGDKIDALVASANATSNSPAGQQGSPDSGGALPDNQALPRRPTSGGILEN